MRIAMVSRYLPSGSKIGVGYQVHLLANGLVERGHQVTVFSQCSACADARYETVTVPVGARLRTFRFAWNLRRADFSGFDVLHGHTDDYWLDTRGRPPHIRTLHGASWAEARNASGWKLRLRMALLALGEQRSVRIADRVVCVSRDTCRYFPGVTGVIPNGVDLTVFHPGGVPEGVPTILFVGTYERRKRGKLLMEIFAREVLPAVPEAQLWMVCEDAPAAPRVSRFCRVPTAELAELYRRAWVFCLPSRYEGFGVPYVEAMASGLPVVATPNPGAEEVLEGGRYGVIAGPELLGATLVRLLTSPEERSRWRAAGLERARQFDRERVLDCYEQLYAEVVAAARG
ncbi:MAG: glycosyltransferase family 4 protein [Chloroherpetonaceae bacterium]|nr:glycosyltransferase family 4 protein [Chthonomonadaceae bacterium]MDW8206935.1 glycosyltransferase family 4 protein [Chloroherpetonaceae bacterium]